MSTNLRAAIEAVVFTSELPVTTSVLKQALPDVETSDLKTALADLAEQYASDERGVELVEVAGGWIFRTKPAFAEVVSRLRQARPVRLSRAALETLAIVAYRQPVTRGGVEDIRGVDSGGVIRTLLEKRLVKIIGRSEAIGNPLLYATTPEFLQVFGLKDLNSLPTLREFQELDDESRAMLPPEDESADDEGNAHAHGEEDSEESSQEEASREAGEQEEEIEGIEAAPEGEEEGQTEEGIGEGEEESRPEEAVEEVREEVHE